MPPGVNFINIFMRSFFKAFLCTANRAPVQVDGVTNPNYKLWCFLTTNFFLQREECTSS
jgi:hypothetical protein